MQTQVRSQRKCCNPVLSSMFWSTPGPLWSTLTNSCTEAAPCLHCTFAFCMQAVLCLWLQCFSSCSARCCCGAASSPMPLQALCTPWPSFATGTWLSWATALYLSLNGLRYALASLLVISGVGLAVGMASKVPGAKPAWLHSVISSNIEHICSDG